MIIPHPMILVSFVAMWATTFWSLQMLKAKDYHLQLDIICNKDWLLLTGQHLAIGISFVIGIVSLIAVLEPPWLVVNEKDNRNKKTIRDKIECWTIK
jgi:hypothetical protein